MFGFSKDSQRWGVNELKGFFLEKRIDYYLIYGVQESEESQEKYLATMVCMILKDLFLDNQNRFSGVERDMLERMLDVNTVEDTVSLEKIENYLRQKIPNFDKLSKKALDNIYNLFKGVTLK